ncbi:hypothetical protein CAPTEDRAFT_193229 [Capitella teleta]|uniref:Ig-like domain-containing protein n=1 Tax=Capitella teleta TaxID=283909 RepID=R7UQT7_CAPTE|nr:hypothetical protein CAPTEDRAFT_193229 [Capitella teleta]|eukprot:ELU05781.1 hypothetical protein CAPTEDRAFT_193229 [Capitella teleta]
MAQTPPVLGEVSPTFLMQNPDDTLDIFCEATANPEPTLTWLKNYKELKETERITISGNRVQIRRLKAEDGGMYTCNFKNSVGQVSHGMKIVVNDGGISVPGGNVYINKAPANVTENEGSRAKMQCEADGYPRNITYHWFKDRQSVQEIHGLMARAAIYADGSLVISSVIKEDSGLYSCRPSNGLGPPPEASAYLNITCECLLS